MRRGDIILVKGIKPFSMLVRRLTKSEYSHVAIYVGNGILVESVYGGVNLNHVSKYEKIDFDVFRPSSTSYRKSKFVDWCIGEVGSGYDYFGILGALYCIITKSRYNPFDLKDYYWCSELAYDGLINSGIIKEECFFGNVISPQEISEIRCVKFVA